MNTLVKFVIAVALFIGITQLMAAVANKTNIIWIYKTAFSVMGHSVTYMLAIAVVLSLSITGKVKL